MAEITGVQDKVSEVTKNLSDEDLRGVAIERLQWANRRRIAWVFTSSTIIFGFLLLTIITLGTKEQVDRVIQATDLLTWVFMGFLTIVALYFGGTVAEKFSGITKKS